MAPTSPYPRKAPAGSSQRQLFPQFARLPPEIQDLIWRFAVHSQNRLQSLSFSDRCVCADPLWEPPAGARRGVPAVARACRAAHRASIEESVFLLDGCAVVDDAVVRARGFRGLARRVREVAVPERFFSAAGDGRARALRVLGDPGLFPRLRRVHVVREVFEAPPAAGLEAMARLSPLAFDGGAPGPVLLGEDDFAGFAAGFDEGAALGWLDGLFWMESTWGLKHDYERLLEVLAGDWPAEIRSCIRQWELQIDRRRIAMDGYRNRTVRTPEFTNAVLFQRPLSWSEKLGVILRRAGFFYYIIVLELLILTGIAISFGGKKIAARSTV